VLSERNRKKRVAALVGLAVRKYGTMKHCKSRPPLNQLILSLFYHTTSVRRATRAFRELKHAFVDWNELRITHPSEAGLAISSAPWAREAAEQIVWLLRELYGQHNRTDLDFLHELNAAQARSCLRSLPMVDRPLADEVLLLSLGVPVLPFSAPAARMCHRLELLPNERPTLKNQRMLARLLDEDCFPVMHMFFCDFADKVCLAQQPLCQQCLAREICRADH